MLSETNRLDPYQGSMKAKIFNSYFGKLDDYRAQASELEEEKTVMDLTYSNTNNQEEEDANRTVPTYVTSNDVSESNQSVLRVLPHHGLLSLPPGPSNYRTVIQHIPTGNHHHHQSGLITILPEQHNSSSTNTRHQPSPASIHSLESHPSASSSPSLNSDCYKSGAGNYSGSEAGGSGIGPMHVTSSSRKKKKQPQPIPEECKDDAYWERRKRNNESAKRSREIRRMKEHHTSIRVVFLEQENLQLRTEVNMLREEVEKLRNLLCSKGSNNNGAAS